MPLRRRKKKEARERKREKKLYLFYKYTHKTYCILLIIKTCYHLLLSILSHFETIISTKGYYKYERVCNNVKIKKKRLKYLVVEGVTLIWLSAKIYCGNYKMLKYERLFFDHLKQLLVIMCFTRLVVCYRFISMIKKTNLMKQLLKIITYNSGYEISDLQVNETFKGSRSVILQ